MIFLRPWWLLALLVPLCFKGFIEKKRGNNPWEKVIDKKLLAALTLEKKSFLSKKTLSKLALLFWSCAVLALSGPAWNKLPVPATQAKPNTVIVLDLNKTLEKKQIQQIQIKLYDILTLLKGERVGLVLYGVRQGYVAMPLTPDTKLIENLIPSLTPSVLPDDAVNVQAGIQKAQEMLNQTGGKGRILFIGFKNPPKSSFPLIFFHPEKTTLKELSSMLSNTTSSLGTSEDWSNQTDIWYDQGIWFALFCLIPATLLFRKNVIFLWLILFFSSTTQASFFKRSDQENYALEQQGITAYRNKDFAKAEQFFKNANALYNKGNALAYQGKIQEAIDAYKEAIKLNPNDKDAQFNKEYLENQLPKEKKQQNNEKQSPSDNQKNSEKNENQEESNQNQEQTEQQENKPESSSSSEDKKNSQEAKSAEQKNLNKEENINSNLEKQTVEEQFNQEEQQILNRLNKDPARVLRYRINLQHQQGF